MPPVFNGFSKTKFNRMDGTPPHCGRQHEVGGERFCRNTTSNSCSMSLTASLPEGSLRKKWRQYFCWKVSDEKFSDDTFRKFATWLDRISSWADHDALLHCLIGPMMMTKPARVKSAVSLGKVSEAVASTCRLCRTDPRSASEDVLPRDHQAIEFAPRRP